MGFALLVMLVVYLGNLKGTLKDVYFFSVIRKRTSEFSFIASALI